MGNVTTGIDFDQYYHHSQGANADGYEILTEI